MTPEEKAMTVPSLRKEGNDLYAAGKWFEAAAKYEEALGLLEQLLLREKPGEPEHTSIDLQRVPFRVNLAQCQFKLKVGRLHSLALRSSLFFFLFFPF
ncbi:unnamed protein product [Dibothriocephalus latus]|uniref:Uncharacterized protein n=1 Tax=Dibothriocephalus latus TaxID=60516 RepID=A0A3P6TK62_DIBLA|nr:unnamed protein product [Dibothriocephalus latus]